MNYKVESIDEHTWLINEYDENNSVYMFLLEGDKEALLLDTGFGTIPLDQIVEELTKKPYYVLNTHAHFDHIGGNFMFDKVYLHQADQEIYALHCGIYREMFPEMMKNPVKEDMEWFEEEYEIQLGNRTLQIIHTPGHSMGCICILDKEAGRLFSGDTCCRANVLLQLEGGTSVAQYDKTIEKLMALSSEYAQIWPSHHTVPVTKEVLEQFHEAAAILLSGMGEGNTEQSPLGKMTVFHYKDVGIVYDKIND